MNRFKRSTFIAMVLAAAFCLAVFQGWGCTAQRTGGGGGGDEAVDGEDGGGADDATTDGEGGGEDAGDDEGDGAGASAAAGETAYASNCQACHGTPGAGDGFAADLAGVDATGLEAGVTGETHPEVAGVAEADYADIAAFLAGDDGEGEADSGSEEGGEGEGDGEGEGEGDGEDLPDGVGGYECLTDAIGVLTMLWIGELEEMTGMMGTPTAIFEERPVPWFYDAEPSDFVFAYVGSREDWVDMEETEGPYLDAGTPLLVSGAPEGDIVLNRQADNTYPFDPLTLVPRTFNPGDIFEWNVPGGVDINGFTKEMPVPEPLTVTSPAMLNELTLDLSTPLEITWEPPTVRTDAHIVVLITSRSEDPFGVVEADLVDDGSATIGTEYLSQLPSGDVVIGIFRAHYGNVPLTMPSGKKVYLSSQTIAVPAL